MEHILELIIGSFGTLLALLFVSEYRRKKAERLVSDKELERDRLETEKEVLQTPLPDLINEHNAEIQRRRGR